MDETQFHNKKSLISAIVQSLDASIGKKDAQSLFDLGIAKAITMEEAMPILKGHVFFKKGVTDLDIQAFYNPGDKTSYFIADRVRADASYDQLRGLALHEIGVHAFQLGRDSQEFDAILKRIETLKELHSLVQAAYQHVPENTPPEHVHEEALAYLVEHHPQLSVSQRFISWFKSALGKFGIKHPLSVEDIVYMAQAALKNATDQDALTESERKGDGVRFSVAPKQKSYLWNRWFRNSKMKRGGEPIIFYHGSPKEFTVFDKSKLATNTTHPSAGLGHFFTEDKGTCYGYGGTVYEVYLSIQKPFVTTSEFLVKVIGNADEAIVYRDKLKKEGYDGVYIKDAGYAVAFDSNQIKLTTNQSPSFGEDIRFSVNSHDKSDDIENSLPLLS